MGYTLEETSILDVYLGEWGLGVSHQYNFGLLLLKLIQQVAHIGVENILVLFKAIQHQRIG
jgi:hypothetical protein